jgi:hypothetical protein
LVCSDADEIRRGSTELRMPGGIILCIEKYKIIAEVVEEGGFR